MEPQFAMWKRLDLVGMDACRFMPTENGWSIEGSALFVEAGQVANVSYELSCGHDWSSVAACIRGWIGKRTINLELKKTTELGWNANGRVLDGFSELVDIDLGFTPASNTNAIRRLGLQTGQEIETTAVWLDTEDWSFKPLKQTYRRISVNRYAYTSPMHGYQAELQVSEFGIVVNYPALWQAEFLTSEKHPNQQAGCSEKT